MLKNIKLYKLKDFNSSIEEVVDYMDHCFTHNSAEFKYAIKQGYQLEQYYDKNGRLNLAKLNDQFYNPPAITKRKNTRPACLIITPFNGSLLIFKYLFVKLFYILISISVFWFINLFLNFNEGFSLFGFNILYGMLTNDLTHEKLWYSKTFPRTVFCDLELKADVNNKHKYSFQCTLAANVFNEKVFIFLWFWFLIVAILNCISLFKWIFYILNRYYLIKSYLNLKTNQRLFHGFSPLANGDTSDNRLVNLFIKNYLQYDGLFVLLLVRANLDDLCFKRLIESLWKMYSISNLSDEDLMSKTPRQISGSNINIGTYQNYQKNHKDEKQFNISSPSSTNVVPNESTLKSQSKGERKLPFNSPIHSKDKDREDRSDSKRNLLEDVTDITGFQDDILYPPIDNDEHLKKQHIRPTESLLRTSKNGDKPGSYV